MKNCPNCAAPINPTQNQCDYCGTHIVDLSRVNLLDLVMLQLGDIECLAYAADIKIDENVYTAETRRNSKGEIVGGSVLASRTFTIKFKEVTP